MRALVPTLRAAVVGLVLATASLVPAHAQSSQCGPTMAANTICGRLGAGQAGPPQAIPFANVTGSIFSAMSGDCTITAAGIITCLKTNGTAFTTLSTLVGVTAGDVAYYNGSAWVVFSGNSSGSKCLLESSAGVPSWFGCGGGSVTSIAIAAGTSAFNATCTVTTSGTCNLPQFLESTWTPAVTASSTAGTPAYSVQVGTYRAIGDLYTVQFDIQLSGWTGSPSGNVSITGLPGNSSATSNDFGACNISTFTTSTSFASMLGRVPSGGANPTISILTIPAGGGTSSGLLTAAQAGTTLVLAGSCTYHS